MPVSLLGMFCFQQGPVSSVSLLTCPLAPAAHHMAPSMGHGKPHHCEPAAQPAQQRAQPTAKVFTGPAMKKRKVWQQAVCMGLAGTHAQLCWCSMHTCHWLKPGPRPMIGQTSSRQRVPHQSCLSTTGSQRCLQDDCIALAGLLLESASRRSHVTVLYSCCIVRLYHVCAWPLLVTYAVRQKWPGMTSGASVNACRHCLSSGCVQIRGR